MSHRDDVGERVDRMEEVKDFVVGFLEGASAPDPATKALWQDDAREAFLNVVAAYDLLPSGEGERPDRSSNVLSILEMAGSKVGQVSNELKSFKTEVADDLPAGSGRPSRKLREPSAH